MPPAANHGGSFIHQTYSRRNPLTTRPPQTPQLHPSQAPAALLPAGAGGAAAAGLPGFPGKDVISLLSFSEL